MDAPTMARRRPHWHVDAKWITGLGLIVVLSATLAVHSLARVTAEKPAVDALSMMLAAALSANGLDDEAEIVEFRQRLRQSPTRSLQPIPGLRIVVREEDFPPSLSAREARLRFFRKWAEPLYAGGAQAFADLADNAQTRDDILGGGGAFNYLTRQTHETLQQRLVPFVAVCLVLLALLMFLSARFGRLGSPGCVLTIVCLPPALVLAVIRSTRDMTPATPAREAGAFAQVNYIAGLVLPPLAEIALTSYALLLAVGVALMVVAVLGDLVSRLARRAGAGG